METASVKEGKLVMGRGANPQMGVEVKARSGLTSSNFDPSASGRRVQRAIAPTIWQSRRYGAETSTSSRSGCRQRKGTSRLTRLRR
jgi:hypothetical protein